MKFIEFNKAKCNSCNICLRSCPSKAISVFENELEIVEDVCISCGLCQVSCTNGALSIVNEVIKVRNAIKSGKKVIASVAPSFIGAFDIDDYRKLIYTLKELGFSAVEETGVGAEVVYEIYKDYIIKGEKKNIITTSCPSANALIEKYYPMMIKYMLPVVSPMIAHGKLIKKNYGDNSYVVFIGPCLAKKVEMVDEQHKNSIDAVLTFEELHEWIKYKGINLNNQDICEFDNSSSKTGSSFPLGIFSDKERNSINNKYELIHACGVEECKEILECLSNNEIENVVVELNICHDSCINGPGNPKDTTSFFVREKRIKNYVVNKKDTQTKININKCETSEFLKEFVNKKVNRKKANDNEINYILRKMGKFKLEDEINCGACGYRTCKEKAESVYEGMSDINMCLLYLQKKAESLRNVIVENTPNIIILLDEDFNVKEFNPKSEKIFYIEAENIMEKPISMIIDDEIFRKVIESEQGFITGVKEYTNYGVVLSYSILHLKEEKLIMAIMSDVTSQMKDKEELKRVKEKTLNAASEVIEKQMRVAQEIASLLGETTAETKVILSKLKKVAIGEEGEI